MALTGTFFYRLIAFCSILLLLTACSSGGSGGEVEQIENQPPQFSSSLSFSVRGNSELSQEIIINDPDSENIEVALSRQPNHGIVSIDYTGEFPVLNYTPDSDYEGDDTVRISVSDGVYTTVETIVIEVLPYDTPIQLSEYSNPTEVIYSQVAEFSTTIDDPDGIIDISFTLAAAEGNWWVLERENLPFTQTGNLYVVDLDTTGLRLGRYAVEASITSIDGDTGSEVKSLHRSVPFELVTCGFCDGIVTLESLGNAISTKTQPDGKILVAGTIGTSSVYVARFLGIGVLDHSFGDSGVFTYSVASRNYDRTRSMVLQDDGKILIAGDTLYDSLLLRLNADGSLDEEFGDSGVTQTRVYLSPPEAPASKLTSYVNLSKAIQLSDGKYAVVGRASYIEDSSINGSVVIRYNQDGSLDNSFNSTGILTVDYSTGLEGINDILQLPDGKLMVLGQRNEPYSNPETFVSLFNTNGSLDIGFGQSSSGTIFIDEIVSSHSLLDHGSYGYLISGSSYEEQVEKNYLVRITPAGVLDLDFGLNGFVDYGDLGRMVNTVSATITDDGKILQTGYSEDYRVMLYRYLPNGEVDATFGNDGVSIAPKIGQYAEPSSIVLQEDGKTVVSGLSLDDEGEVWSLLLVRFTSDGTLDDNGIIID